MTLRATNEAALTRDKYRRLEEETRVFGRLAKKFEQDQAAMQAQMDKEMHALQQLQEIATQKNNSIFLSDELPGIEVDFDRSQLIVIAGKMLQEKLVRYLAQPSARAYNYSYNVPEEPAAIAPAAPESSTPAVESRKTHRGVTVHPNPTDCGCPEAPEIHTTRRPASLRETATLGSTMSAVELEKMATIIGGQWETLVEKEIEVLEQQIREKAKQTHVVDPRVKLTVPGRARVTRPVVVQL
jgi:hypothetical protein